MPAAWHSLDDSAAPRSRATIGGQTSGHAASRRPRPAWATLVHSFFDQVGQRRDKMRMVPTVAARTRFNPRPRLLSCASTSMSYNTSRWSERKPIGRTETSETPVAVSEPDGHRCPARARDRSDVRYGSDRPGPNAMPEFQTFTHKSAGFAQLLGITRSLRHRLRNAVGRKGDMQLLTGARRESSPWLRAVGRRWPR